MCLCKHKHTQHAVIRSIHARHYFGMRQWFTMSWIDFPTKFYPWLCPKCLNSHSSFCQQEWEPPLLSVPVIRVEWPHPPSFEGRGEREHISPSWYVWTCDSRLRTRSMPNQTRIFFFLLSFRNHWEKKETFFLLRLPKWNMVWLELLLILLLIPKNGNWPKNELNRIKSRDKTSKGYPKYPDSLCPFPGCSVTQINQSALFINMETWDIQHGANSSNN